MGAGVHITDSCLSAFKMQGYVFYVNSLAGSDKPRRGKPRGGSHLGFLECYFQ